jgi:hypothetical protein
MRRDSNHEWVAASRTGRSRDWGVCEKKKEIGARRQTSSPIVYLADFIPFAVRRRVSFSSEIADSYSEGASLQKLARLHRVSKNTARRTLQDQGVAIRHSKNWQDGYFRGTPPYGFVAIDGKLMACPREQQNLQIILKLWQSGSTIADITRHMNHHKIQPRRAREWHYMTIRSILKYQSAQNQKSKETEL